ncbi:CrcB family protein [Salinibacterium sp. SYSU T00001]|uniref:fluoride efflux transporter FluC n=1 Tax=Homoserinimonas sedimenticola TaxID=2986805 RepID=UPI002236104E|nr:CrcB family protein [Salinibacterium sedimenticola]MCW4385507.1 CrcB family protein [Salinibacterium sedimenticola]
MASGAGWREFAAVAVGGMLGTGLRLGIDLVLPLADFPVSTLLVNSVGSFALAFLVAQHWGSLKPWARAGLGPGLLGSFTTFSAVAVSLVDMGTTGEWMLAAAYLAATLLLGLGAAAVGLRMGAPR